VINGNSAKHDGTKDFWIASHDQYAKIGGQVLPKKIIKVSPGDTVSLSEPRVTVSHVDGTQEVTHNQDKPYILFWTDPRGPAYQLQSNPTKNIYFSQRLRMYQQLKCPSALEDSDGTINWWFAKFNGSSYESILFTNNTATNDSVFNKTPVGQEYVLGSSPITAVDKVAFSGITAVSQTAYLDETTLTNRVCEKQICPLGYSQVVGDANVNLCQIKIARPKINTIPKTLYLVYPGFGNDGLYSVPDITKYFEGSGLTFRITGVGKYLNVSLDGTKLNIQTLMPSGDDKVTVDGGLPLTTGFSLIVSSPIKSIAPTNTLPIIFPDRVLEMKLDISVQLFSPDYIETSKSFWRCDALTK
jgi:hypothetical protein